MNPNDAFSVVDPQAVPEGLPRQFAATHCYQVFLMHEVTGEFMGVNAGGAAVRGLTFEQACQAQTQHNHWMETRGRRSGELPMVPVILRVTAALEWVDDGERFGLYFKREWLNENWAGLEQRVRRLTGQVLLSPQAGSELRWPGRAASLAAYAAAAQPKPRPTASDQAAAVEVEEEETATPVFQHMLESHLDATPAGTRYRGLEDFEQV